MRDDDVRPEHDLGIVARGGPARARREQTGLDGGRPHVHGQHTARPAADGGDAEDAVPIRLSPEDGLRPPAGPAQRGRQRPEQGQRQVVVAVAPSAEHPNQALGIGGVVIEARGRQLKVHALDQAARGRVVGRQRLGGPQGDLQVDLVALLGQEDVHVPVTHQRAAGQVASCGDLVAARQTPDLALADFDQAAPAGALAGAVVADGKVRLSRGVEQAGARRHFGRHDGRMECDPGHRCAIPPDSATRA